MRKSRFTFNLLTCLSLAIGSLALTSAPASAAGTSLSLVEVTTSIHDSGVAILGGATAPAMSNALSNDLQPYAYGKYAVIWNLTNPELKSIESYSVATFKCDTLAGVNALIFDPARCGAPASRPVVTVYAGNPMRRTSDWTFTQQIGANALHKKWIKARLRIDFTDGTYVQSWTRSRYFISDGARNEIPTASVRGADKKSVPQNTAMTMTFNYWTGLGNWAATSTNITRATVVFRCDARPTDRLNGFVSYTEAPAGCTRLVRNGLLEPHDGLQVVLNFTSGAKGTFIYAFDTLAFNAMPGVNDVVYLQKRAIYSTYDPGELPGGPAPGAGGADPGAGLTALQVAGIDTTVAPIVSETGQVTSNGITAVIDANGRYKRGTQRRAIKVRIQPNNKSQGAVVAALVSSAGGVDTVHLAKDKIVRNGKARWRWRFPDTLPRGRYKIYVSFTPTDATVSPMTITKRVRLR
jgi:hypothetical protein